MNYLKSKAINLGYVTKLLYGDNSSASRKKMSVKVRGFQNFTDEEKVKLEQIQKQIIAELSRF